MSQVKDEGIGCALMILAGSIGATLIIWALSGFPGIK